MRSVLDNDGWNRIERLVGELRAIESWDAEYWRNSDPEADKMLAFVARQERRAEILSQLLTLFRDWMVVVRDRGTTRKSSQRTEGDLRQRRIS